MEYVKVVWIASLCCDVEKAFHGIFVPNFNQIDQGNLITSNINLYFYAKYDS
jgi:hypothetical protein